MSGNIEKPESYFEVSLDIPQSIQEPVCDYIIENLARGLILEEEEDSDTIGIKFYLPEAAGIVFKENLLRFIDSQSSDFVLNPDNIRIKTIANIEWEEAYKESIKATIIDNVVIRPPWVKYISSSDKIEIVIEPKMAFGTGSHETTRLCIREILKYFKSGMTLFDLGCGSGILSILAAKLGGRDIRGVDIDMIAVQNGRENIIINEVSERVEIEFGSIEKVHEHIRYDVLTANIIKSTIVELYNKIDKAVKSGGIIILSGLLQQDQESIGDLLNRYGNVEKFEINEDGQWLAYTIFKK
jgi:ribosomal protein L11 methyltransferase